MKQALKRIEEALSQLETRKNAANAQPDTAKRSYSFDLLKPPKSNSPKQRKEVAKSPELPYLNALGNSHLPAEETNLEVSSLPEHLTEDSNDRRRSGGSEGTLESEPNNSELSQHNSQLKVQATGYRQSDKESAASLQQSSSFNDGVLIQNHATCFNGGNLHNAVEPSSKSQNSGVSPDEAIEQVVHQIQELYHSGPIVDGYLEYYPPAPEPGDPTLREVCFERVIDNLEEVGMTSGQEIGLPGASYRICGVDASEQQWSYPCPLDQLPSVSMAIARYQKLQQLLQQKHELEQNRVNKDEG